METEREQAGILVQRDGWCLRDSARDLKDVYAKSGVRLGFVTKRGNITKNIVTNISPPGNLPWKEEGAGEEEEESAHTGRRNR